MFRLRGVKKSWGTQLAVEVDLDLPRGKTTVLLGPSGCGKSTLLRLCMGLVAPDAGEILFDGAPLDRASRRRIGYVIQEGGLFPHLTAKDNVAMLARHLGWRAARVDERLRELTALVRLEPSMLERYPVELSGGERQRVGIMRALMLDPPLLLLDEPMGALDPMVRARLQQDLKRIFAELAKTVILVTHSLEEAAFLGDEVLLMREGRIVQRGTMRDLETATDPFTREFVELQRGPRTAGLEA